MYELLGLPEELIEHILLLLPFSDRKNTRLVCKKFLQFSSRDCFTSNTVFVIKSYNNLNDYISENVPKIVDLKIRINEDNVVALNQQRQVDNFWRKYGSSVTSVVLVFKIYCHEILQEICENCPNLEALSLIILDKNKSEGKGVKIRSCVSNPKLKILHLKFMTWILDESILKSLLENSSTLRNISTDMPKCNVSRSKIMRQLAPLVKEQLNSLSLNCSKRTDTIDDIERLLETDNNLKKFHLSKNEISNNLIRQISVNSKELETLSLSGHFSRSSMNFSAFRNLTHVSLSNTTAIKDESIESLDNLHNLKCLNLSVCPRITDDGITAIFGNKSWPGVIHLHIYGLFITNVSLEAILPNLPNITLLSIQKCPKLSLDFVNTVFKHNHCLESLTINMPCRIKYLYPLFPGLNNLKHIVHINLSNYSVTSLLGLSLYGLETIVISSKASRFAVERIFSNCHSLNYILSLQEDVYIDGIRYYLYSALNRMIREETLYLPVNSYQCEIPHFRSLIK